MKKIIVFLICLFGFFPITTYATEVTLEEEYLKGVYYIQITKERGFHSHQQAIFHLDGKIAYCLEPEVPAHPGNYQILEGLEEISLSEEEKNKIEEFGYYGYEYPGHQHIYYYLAAQELIWENVSNLEIMWSTRGDGTGEEINIEKEKNEIVDLILNQKKTPSFHQKKISLYEGEKLKIEDDNHILSQFKIDNKKFHTENNTLLSEPLWEDTKITGTLKSYDDGVSLLYLQENSQKLATLRLSSPTQFNLFINIEGTSITIHKIGEVWDGIYNSGNWIEQDGVEFEIYAAMDIVDAGRIIYKKDEYIETIVTKDGYAKTRRLPEGQYKLIEKKPKINYVPSPPVIVEINHSLTENPEIEIKNKLSTGKIELLKKNMSGKPLAGVIFGLFDKNGNKLDEKITDEKGQIIWESLPIGDYQIKEIKTRKGYLLDEKVDIVTVVENKTTPVEKINILLPNTSGKKANHYLFIVSFIIFIVCKKIVIW